MRQRAPPRRFPVQANGASRPWRGAKEVPGVTLVVAQEVPTSSCMAVPHGPAGVGTARHRMREQLRIGGLPESVVDDAVLILSELLSNACRHGRPLGAREIGDGDIRAAWRVDKAGRLTVEVTDGAGPPVPFRPRPRSPRAAAGAEHHQRPGPGLGCPGRRGRRGHRMGDGRVRAPARRFRYARHCARDRLRRPLRRHGALTRDSRPGSAADPRRTRPGSPARRPAVVDDDHDGDDPAIDDPRPSGSARRPCSRPHPPGCGGTNG